MKIKDKSKIKGRFRLTSFKSGTKEIIKQTDWFDNLVTFANGHGNNLIMHHMMGTTSISLEVAIAKLGDDVTAPTDNDTDLISVIVDDIELATKTDGTSSLVFTFFAPDAQVPEDDYEEVGIFCDKNEKRLFARAIIDPTFTKSIGEDTQIEYSVNFFNA
jgi:hypothetical protein